MSAFVEPGSDTSEPSFTELLYLWTDLPEWRRRQVLDLHGVEHGGRHPLSALLAVASVAELIIDVRIVMEPSGGGQGRPSPVWNSSERHVVLEWPPRAQLALMCHDMRIRARPSRDAEPA